MAWHICQSIAGTNRNIMQYLLTRRQTSNLTAYFWRSLHISIESQYLQNPKHVNSLSKTCNYIQKLPVVTVRISFWWIWSTSLLFASIIPFAGAAACTPCPAGSYTASTGAFASDPSFWHHCASVKMIIYVLAYISCSRFERDRLAGGAQAGPPPASVPRALLGHTLPPQVCVTVWAAAGAPHPCFWLVIDIHHGMLQNLAIRWLIIWSKVLASLSASA